MGSVGQPPTGYRGFRIVDMAARIAAGIERGAADLTNPALARVLELRDSGIKAIDELDQPYALSLLDSIWFVREGVHRSIAMVMLGAQTVNGLTFESAVLS